MIFTHNKGFLSPWHAAQCQQSSVVMNFIFSSTRKKKTLLKQQEYKTVICQRWWSYFIILWDQCSRLPLSPCVMRNVRQCGNMTSLLLPLSEIIFVVTTHKYKTIESSCGIRTITVWRLNHQREQKKKRAEQWLVFLPKVPQCHYDIDTSRLGCMFYHNS